MPSILIVDDEETLARALARFLDRRRYHTTVAVSGEQARGVLGKSRPDLVLLDQRLGDEDGLELLRAARETDADLPVIMMTAYGSVDTAVAAMKAGARDYIQKPVDLEQLGLLVERALGEARTQARLERLDDGRHAPGLLGTSAAMQPVREFCERMTELDGLQAGEYPTVLLLGETGTGKSLVARMLHQASALARGPLLVFDCTVVPRDLMEAELFGFERGAFTDAKSAKAGLVEVAEGGTLFLDEVGELDPGAQAKLLRVLEERRVRRLGGLTDLSVNTRIIAATNRDLEREAAEGRFRQDLFYRLNVLTLTLPPLRAREDDIAVLAQHFVEMYARKYARPTRCLAPDTLEVLRTERWVGNVRELAHVIERAILMGDGESVEVRDLALPGQPAGEEERAPTRLDEVERTLMRRVLSECDGNVSAAARRLGVSRELLRYRMRKHGIR